MGLGNGHLELTTGTRLQDVLRQLIAWIRMMDVTVNHGEVKMEFYRESYLVPWNVKYS